MKDEKPKLSRKKVTRGNYIPDKGRKPTGKSDTIQNDATSIKDMLIRYAAGEVNLGGKNGIYVDDADEDDIDGQQFAQMDPADQEDVLTGMRAMRERLKALEQEYDEAIKERNKAKTDPPKNAQNEG